MYDVTIRLMYVRVPAESVEQAMDAVVAALPVDSIQASCDAVGAEKVVVQPIAFLSEYCCE